jgi:hypothetical protein
MFSITKVRTPSKIRGGTFNCKHRSFCEARKLQSDAELEKLVEKFRLCTLAENKWTHAAHLAVAVWFVNKYELEEAICWVKGHIVLFNAATGKSNSPSSGYHETLTQFWLRNADSFLKNHKNENLNIQLRSFLQSKESHKDYPLEFYSRDLIFSVQARSSWVPPNLKALPFPRPF